MEHQIPIIEMEQEPLVGKSEKTQEIPDQIRELSDRVSLAFREFKESETYEKLLESRETARDYIRNNPLASLGYALGAGLFLGLLIKRNR